MINKPIGEFQTMLIELNQLRVELEKTDDMADCIDGFLIQVRLPGTAFIGIRTTLLDSECIRVVQGLLEQRASVFLKKDTFLPVELHYSLKEALVI